MRRITAKLFFCFVLAINFGSASAAPKSIVGLFPGNVPLDTSQIYSLSSPQYKALVLCQRNGFCTPSNVGRFFSLSAPSPRVDDSFDILNRCVGLHGFIRYAKDFQNGAHVPAGDLVLTPTTVDCPNLLPDEVIGLQLSACYTLASGAYCSLATLCFEGQNAKGLCSRDYPAEALYISAAGVVPLTPTVTPSGSPLPSPTPFPTVSPSPVPTVSPSPAPTVSPSPSPLPPGFDCNQLNVNNIQGVGGCADPNETFSIFDTNEGPNGECICQQIVITSVCLYSDTKYCHL